jgi:Fe2+ or Zn2+ uptake regulation protein
VQEISWIACPVEWRHQVDHTNFVCLECGAEAVEIPAERVRKLFDEATKPENLNPKTDDNFKTQ